MPPAAPLPTPAAAPALAEPLSLPPSAEALIEARLSPAAADCLDALARLALALRVACPTPAALAAAAAQLVEWVYELVQALEAQVSAASAALDSLLALQARLDAGAAEQAAATAADREAAEADAAKAADYGARQEQYRSRLEQAGFREELRHSRLQAQSRQAAALAAECERLAVQLRRYAGLPADMAAARAAHAERQARLARLRQQVQQGMDGLSHERDFPAPLVAGLPALTTAEARFAANADVDAKPGTLRRGLRAAAGARARRGAHAESLCSVCSVDYCLVQDIARGLDPAPRLVDLNPPSLEDVIADVERVGRTLGLPCVAAAAAAALRARASAARDAAAAAERERGAAERAGLPRSRVAFIECEGGPAPPSPPITPQQLVASRPDWAITAPCGLNVAATARREEERGIAGAA
eukprot:scaffold26.g3356.t1